MHRGYQGYNYPYYQLTQNRYAPPQKYPQDIECVVVSSNPEKGAIYVSNVEAAENPATLKKHKIKAVMTCAKGYHTNIPKSQIDMFQYFPCDDKDSCPISIYFDDAVNFIVKALQKTNILVHCIAGVSRSVSMVIAYLIRQKNMSFQQAFQEVKRRRKIISPNNGFIRQLKQYAQKHNGSSYKTAKKNQHNNYFQQQKYKYVSKTAQANRHSNINGNTSADKFRNNDQDLVPKRKQSLPQSPRFGYTSSVSLKDIQINDIHKKQNEDGNFMKSHSFIDSRQDHIATPNKTNNKGLRDYDKNSTTTPGKSAYFKEMNRQLNQKIAAIHQKYEKQRQKLLDKRGYSTGTKINYQNYENKKTDNFFYDAPKNKEIQHSYKNGKTIDGDILREKYRMSSNKKYDYRGYDVGQRVSYRDPFKYSNYLSDHKYKFDRTSYGYGTDFSYDGLYKRRY